MFRRHLLGFLFVMLFVAPAWSVMFAQAQGGTISTFSTGSAEETVTLSSGQNSAVGFELERNTTVTSASFFIKPTISGTSPGSLELDVNQDGFPEWAFNDTGYGDFGHQTLFSSGNTTETLTIDPNQGTVSNPDSPPFYIPTGASISSTALDVGFSPVLSGGYFQTGYIHAVDKGDLNNDNNTDFALLSRTASINSTGPTGPTTVQATAFRTVAYSNNTGITMSSWQTTCTNATRIMMADVNGDNHDDVVGYAPADDQLCIHFTNTTSGGFEPQVNVTHASNIIDLAFGDFTGNGQDEMVSIRSGGKVFVDQFSNRTNAFSNRDSNTITASGSQNAVTLTHMLFAYFDGPQNNPSLIAAQSDGTANQVFWSPTSGSIAISTATIGGVFPASVIGDFDGDQDLDIVAPRASGHRSIENNQAFGWDGDNHNGILELTNATIFDYDLDQAAHLLVMNLGNPDGNPATFTGNVTTYGFTSWGNSQNRVQSQADEILEPWTSPRAVHFGDMDGDGSIEQLVLVGEGSQNGVFISAYHKVGYDIDQDGVVDVEGKGYAGNGSNGLSMLMIEDTTGELTTTLNFLSPGLPYASDGYGIQMSPVNLSMHSITEGTFTLSGLDVHYTADFLVNANPSVSGNLSNVLNQQMTAGSGQFVVPFHFNSTNNGSFVVYNPSVAYVDGAPNIALPPTPIPGFVDVEPDRVVIEWQPITDFGDDLLEFIVYRSASGQSIDLQNPYTSEVANSTIDFAVQPGQSWTYWVQSTHRFGVASNLSLPITTAVPYPIPKSFIPNLTASDVPEDEGGAVNISWSPGDASIVEHRIFVLPSDFSEVSGQSTNLTAEASATSLVVHEDSNGNPLVDGAGYYVAAIGMDVYGNASTNVTAIGPVYSRNDSALSTMVDVSYTDFTGGELDGMVLLARTKGLDVSAHLHQNGTGIANATMTLTISGTDEAYDVEMTTNATGHATLSVDSLSSLGPIDAVGEMNLTLAYAGSDGDEMNQPLEGISTTSAAFGTVLVMLTADEPIPVQTDGFFETIIAVDAEDSVQSMYLANMGVAWQATDSSGEELSNGTAEVRGNELSVLGTAAYDGRLTLTLHDEPPTFYIPGFSASYALQSAPAVNDTTNDTDETNQTTEPTFPDVTLPATVDCGTVTYEWDSNATDVGITCTVTNPNPFDVMVGFAWKVVPGTPPAIELVHNEADGDTPSLPAEANGTVDLTFSLVRNGPTEGMIPGLQGEGYVVYLTCLDFGDNACDSMTEDTASTEGELLWTLGEIPVQTVDDTLIEDDASNAMTPVLVGIGVVIAIIAAIVGVLYLRGRDDLDFFDDDDEDEDYFEQALSSPDSTSRVKDVDLTASKSLDELKESGKSLHSDAPEGLATSSSLGSRADAFEFGATAENAAVEEAGEEEAEEEESWEEEAAAEDDGITVDENGTEWWEDEEGTWWYREDGWEDWAVWED
jgi:hypothetical protein